MSCPCPQCANMVEHVTYVDDMTPIESIYDRLRKEYELSGRGELSDIADDIDELDDELRQVIRELPRGCSIKNKLERIREKLW